MNTANFNLEAHSSSAALQMVEGPVVPIPHPSVVALGAVGSIPGGLSVVEEGKIPYKKIGEVTGAEIIFGEFFEVKLISAQKHFNDGLKLSISD